MRIPNWRRPASHSLRRSRQARLCPNLAHLCWTLPILILLSTSFLAADTAKHPQHSRVRHTAKHPAAQNAVTPTPPPAPPAPNWPINNQPQPPHVTWDSQGLRIVASNSSLSQILHDISAATGVRVEGFSSDQRIFGTYGPGPAREVLSQLLNGSGYNVLMLGGHGEEPPTRIVLSQRPTGPAPPVPPSEQSSDYDNGYQMDSAPAPPVVPVRPGFQPSPPVRTPQQIMEEMERRRQQMQQQQQQPNSPNE